MAQSQSALDSLRLVWSDSAVNPEDRIDALIRGARMGMGSSPDSSFKLAIKAHELCKMHNLERQRALALITAGISYDIRGLYPEAQKYFYQSLKIREKLKDTLGISASMGNMAIIHFRQTQDDLSMKYHKLSLDLTRKFLLKKRSPEDTREAKSGIAAALNNMGLLHMERKEFQEAQSKFNQAVTIREELGDSLGLANAIGNLGLVYGNTGRYDSAILFHNRSLAIKHAIGDSRGVAHSYGSIAKWLHAAEKYNQSIDYANKCISLSRSIGLMEIEGKGYGSLWKSLAKIGRYREAVEAQSHYHALKDSVTNIANTRKLLQLDMGYEFGQKQLADSLLNAKRRAEEQLKHEQAISHQKNISIGGIIGFVFMLAISFLIYRSYRQKKEDNQIISAQKEEVEKQKELVEERNREILDSINYAKRLQEAILPPNKIVKEYLEESFILYLPKDVVAGDFYWMETVGDTVYFAAADCTGHGVPGAMVSVVCSNALSKALIEEGCEEPGPLLDRTRELVVQRFGRGEEEIKDGMDISLCALNTKTSKLRWAGANNPLWIIRPSSGVVDEVKADKQPIGSYAVEAPFTTHTVNLNTGDCIYIFSDGYPDQFGGDRGKKYKSGKLKQFLLSIHDKSMAEQRILLLEEFESWKGELDQIDDVCVMGVKV